MGVVVIRNCQLVQGLGWEAEGGAAIRVRNGVIEAMGPETDVLDAAEAEHAVVDALGAYVLPGLIDMHTHLSVVHPGTTDVLALGRENEYDVALRTAARPRETVRAGVTTVRLVSEKGRSRHRSAARAPEGARRGAVHRHRELGDHEHWWPRAGSACRGGRWSRRVPSCGAGPAEAGGGPHKIMISRAISDEEDDDLDSCS
jgi:imidazolonepropionase-like amidohydrolase